MKSVINKSFRGLPHNYYFRNFILGLILPIILSFTIFQSKMTTETLITFTLFTVLNTLLYPYSRFVYEKILGFIIGDNVFYGNAIIVLLFKLFTMWLCWFFAFVVAPAGLIYLYFNAEK